MNDEINYKTNPLHGLSLKTLLTEIVDHYGFEILFAYLNINCFKTNPSIESSIKFLKKTDWAREKVEAFYMYQFKNLPKASSDQFLLPPRDRVVPEGDIPGEPKKLSLEDAERLREKRAHNAALRDQEKGQQSDKRPDAKRDTPSKDQEDSSVWKATPKPPTPQSTTAEVKIDPWANAKNKLKN